MHYILGMGQGDNAANIVGSSDRDKEAATQSEEHKMNLS